MKLSEKQDRTAKRIGKRIKPQNRSVYFGYLTYSEIVFLVDVIEVHPNQSTSYYRERAKQGMNGAVWFYFTASKEQLKLLGVEDKPKKRHH